MTMLRRGTTWIAGFKGNWQGFLLGVLLSLRPSRLKLYPEFVAGFMLLISFILVLFLSEG